jgi:protein-disulfide isomerase
MSRLRENLRPDDHVAGPRDAPVILVEYGDFECRHCGRAAEAVRQVRAVLGDQLCYVYRHFPLSQAHPHAMQAAEASEAAGAQGRFWEMHDLLFENPRALELDALVSYAEELGLDLEQFGLDFGERRSLERIHRDFMSGVRSGMNGTPTFFINGVRHDGDCSADALLKAIRGGVPAYCP